MNTIFWIVGIGFGLAFLNIILQKSGKEEAAGLVYGVAVVGGGLFLILKAGGMFL